MKGRYPAADVDELNTDVLDHAREFTGIVSLAAPGEYRSLLNRSRFQPLLDEKNSFNHGKLYVYADFLVFQREFNARFPRASRASCINAFSSLFLKNDISITNLIHFIEGNDELKQLRLHNQPDSDP